MAKEREKVPWYADGAGFFGSGFAREYKEIFTQERTTKEVDFFEGALKLKPGARILDLACGAGRHAVELARRGYEVTGQDINSFFLEEAQASAVLAGVSVRWIKGDMRSIPFVNEYDAVLNLSAFGYLESDEEDEKVVFQAASALKQRGLFVLDYLNRERVIRTYKTREVRMLSDGSVVITKRRFDPVTGRNYEQRIRKWRGGESEDASIVVRRYALTELTAMCKRAGLDFAAAYGDHGGEPLTLDAKRAILVAQKT